MVFFFFFLFLRWLQNTERGFFFFVLLFSNPKSINMFCSSMNLPFFSRARASVCVCVLMCTIAFPRQLSGRFFFSVLLLFPVPW